jgi:hypothetical protein
MRYYRIDMDELKRTRSLQVEHFDWNRDRWILHCYFPEEKNDTLLLTIFMAPHPEDIQATKQCCNTILHACNASLTRRMPTELIRLISDYAGEKFVYGGQGKHNRKVRLVFLSTNPIQSISKDFKICLGQGFSLHLESACKPKYNLLFDGGRTLQFGFEVDQTSSYSRKTMRKWRFLDEWLLLISKSLLFNTVTAAMEFFPIRLQLSHLLFSDRCMKVTTYPCPYQSYYNWFKCFVYSFLASTFLPLRDGKEKIFSFLMGLFMCYLEYEITRNILIPTPTKSTFSYWYLVGFRLSHGIEHCIALRLKHRLASFRQRLGPFLYGQLIVFLGGSLSYPLHTMYRNQMVLGRSNIFPLVILPPLVVRKLARKNFH